MKESRCLHMVSPVLSDTSDLFMWLIPDSDITLNLDKRTKLFTIRLSYLSLNSL